MFGFRGPGGGIGWMDRHDNRRCRQGESGVLEREGGVSFAHLAAFSAAPAGVLFVSVQGSTGAPGCKHERNEIDSETGVQCQEETKVWGRQNCVFGGTGWWAGMEPAEACQLSAAPPPLD
jgi:hypothetical protein